MTALPLPQVATPTGQADGPGQARTAGQPRTPREWGAIGQTAAGCPVMVFNFQPWASLYLVTITHAGRRMRTWVFGNPARLVEHARETYRHVTAEPWPDLDEALARFEPD